MLITYEDKVNLHTSEVPRKNKVTDADLNEIKQVVNVNANPIGSGMEYFGSSLPDNYLWADGSAVSRTTYADLFAVIGTAYGEGDGVDTFNLPDLRRRHPVMKNSGDTIGTQGGNNVLFAMANPTSAGINYKNAGKSFITDYYTDGASLTKAFGGRENSNAGILIRGDVDDSSKEAYLIVNYIIRYR